MSTRLELLQEATALTEQITAERNKLAAAIASQEKQILEASGDYCRPDHGMILAGLRELEKLLPQRQAATRQKIAALEIQIERQNQ